MGEGERQLDTGLFADHLTAEPSSIKLHFANLQARSLLLPRHELQEPQYSERRCVILLQTYALQGLLLR